MLICRIYPSDRAHHLIQFPHVSESPGIAFGRGHRERKSQNSAFITWSAEIYPRLARFSSTWHEADFMRGIRSNCLRVADDPSKVRRQKD